MSKVHLNENRPTINGTPATTHVATDNYAENIIGNGTVKQKRSRAINMIFNFVRYQFR